MDDDFDALTASKAEDLAKPLQDAKIPYKIHIVKDHDMKERLCLEVERLGLSAVIMGSKGFGAARRASKGRLGSVSDYCVHHCICPVVVVRSPADAAPEGGEATSVLDAAVGAEDVLHPVPEEDAEYHDATEEHKGNCCYTFLSLCPTTHQIFMDYFQHKSIMILVIELYIFILFLDNYIELTR
jgi:hypothetical protein